MLSSIALTPAMSLPTVYDGVFSPSACRHIHTAASLGGLGDECHTLYRRAATPPRTALETAVESVLTQLDDRSPMVEYWWRDSWEHVEAHADVDEFLFERDETFRYPHHGHVLYLSVSGGVRGGREGSGGGGEGQVHLARDDGAARPAFVVRGGRGRGGTLTAASCGAAGGAEEAG